VNRDRTSPTMISIALELGLRKRENNIFTIRKTMTKLENKQNIYLSEIASVRDLLGDDLANDLTRFVTSRNYK
jgi:hypothetical protein